MDFETIEGDAKKYFGKNKDELDLVEELICVEKKSKG